VWETRCSRSRWAAPVCYSDIATGSKIRKPRSAVGAAVGRNPLRSWCLHRALARAGRAAGYHWGITRKQAMLGWRRTVGVHWVSQLRRACSSRSVRPKAVHQAWTQMRKQTPCKVGWPGSLALRCPGAREENGPSSRPNLTADPPPCARLRGRLDFCIPQALFSSFNNRGLEFVRILHTRCLWRKLPRHSKFYELEKTSRGRRFIASQRESV